MRAILLFTILAFQPLCAADWPEFLGPNRDNTSPETGLLDAWPASGLPVVWQKNIGTGYSAPSVRDGMLVLHHRLQDEEIVTAMAATTGQTLWEHRTPTQFEDPYGYNNGPRCSPLLTQEYCYTFGAEGVLLCLDRKTGRVIWKRETGKDFDVPAAFFGVGSSPILVDGRLIVQIGGQPNSGVVAFDAHTGRTLWENGGERTWNGVLMKGWPGEPFVKWDTAHPGFQKMASYCTPVLADIHGRKQVLVVMRQGLLSLDPETGAHYFAYWFRSSREESVNAMTPVALGDRIFLSSAYYKTGSVLLQVRPDGRGVDEVWRSLAMEMHWARPNLINGYLYGFSGRNEPDSVFRCVEFATGKVRWERDERWRKAGYGKQSSDTPPEVFARGSTIFADGKLIALGEAGLLGLFQPDPTKLREISRWQVPGMTYPTWAGPVLAGRKLYLRSEEKLICLALAK